MKKRTVAKVYSSQCLELVQFNFFTVGSFLGLYSCNILRYINTREVVVVVGILERIHYKNKKGKRVASLQEIASLQHAAT